MCIRDSTIAGYGAVGAGIPPYEIKEVITVVKAYSSAVGAGAVSYTHLDVYKRQKMQRIY